MYMYVNNLTGPWFSVYNVRKCEVERIRDHRNRSLAVPRDCPHKIKFVRGGNVENVKSALWGL